MRLHSLEISAFGPFAETAAVDFDRLSGAGLFLLSGATGAGKTSVLDAVCFALYGDVPGDRSTAKRLRSDQARPGQAPRVTLEATLSGRRFRFERSPSWERAKKRGTGTTTEQASVVVSERMRGRWVTLSTRLDEAGHLVGTLVGMNLTQFTQVAMLPQGRFQTFLRARSEDRHALLQKLFRTGRFEDVERWLRDRRTELRRGAAQRHLDIADLLSRVSEVTDTPPGAEWDLHDLSGPLREGLVQAWVGRRGKSAAAALADAQSAVREHAVTEAASRARLEQETARVVRRQRLRAAREELRALDADKDAHVRARARLAAEARAAPVVGPLRTLDRARAAREVSEVRWLEAAGAAGAVPGDGPDDGLTGGPAVGPAGEWMARAGDADLVPLLEHACRRATDRAAAVRALQPRERELVRLRAELQSLTAQHATSVSSQEQLGRRVDALPDQVAEAEAQVTEAEVAERGVLACRPEHRDLTTRLQAARQARVLAEELPEARAAYVVAREARLDRVEESQLIREARLTSMAAEIAGGLAVGSSCPVCGSCEHPLKASPAPDAVDEQRERLAQRAVVDAQAEEHLRQSHLRDLETRVAGLVERADGTEAALAEQLAEVNGALAVHAALAGELPARRSRLTALSREHTELVALRHRAVVDGAALATRVDAAEVAQARLAAEVASAVLGTGHETLTALVWALEQRVTALEAARARLQDLLRDREAESVAEAEVRRQLDEAGFPEADDARAAVLPTHAADALRSAVGEHERRRAAVQALLAEFADSTDSTDSTDLGDDGSAAAGTDAREQTAAAEQAHLATLELAHQEALARLGEARGDTGRAGACVERLVDLTTRLDDAIRAWRPLSDDLELVTRLSTFAEGRSADNRLQMRLSAYVLAHRLSQVVAAANERLGAMSDQRYALEHTARRGAGESRGGLSLLVRDDWSGESRDPATLSGGETFVVSLALALGLADVITREAGGADLDTLFVDEGFGSLDADTLDDVMDTLDTLRDGGRVVGVVSHVAEMRDRIPTRLLVAKSRSGSTLTQVP